MGSCLIIALTLSDWLVVLPLAALGLGAVIFVHELGHFAVAKMCGVKCEKFFVGFDIGGYKLSRKWGETEYGIGILPLGGYVKMLGQDDNPANIAEQVRESEVRGNTAVETKEITGPDGKKYLVDNRSYLAKNVPQRMAIISAGVIMNVIFAFIFAVVAYGLGVPYIPCIISETAPGSAAYQAGLRTGDEIVRIGDKTNPSFTDLKSDVTLADLQSGVNFGIRRVGSDTIESITLTPKQGSGLAKIGIAPPYSLRLFEGTPVLPGSPAANAAAEFQGGDEIIKVNGIAVANYHDYVTQLLEHVDEPLEITVRRGGEPTKEDPLGSRVGGEQVTITVPARPMLRFGLVMEMGKIAAVQQNSPAAEKGIQPDDFIDRISNPSDNLGEETEAEGTYNDPIALPAQLRQLANENREIRLTLRTSDLGDDSRDATREVVVPLRKVDWLEGIVVGKNPLSVPALGLAYHVLNRVSNVVPGSPAAEAGLQQEDVITRAELLIPEIKGEKPEPYVFGTQGNSSWPALIRRLQLLPPDTKVELTYRRGAETNTVTLEPQPVDDAYYPERGFAFEPMRKIHQAESIGEAVLLGYDRTLESLGMVFRFLQKLGTQVPFTALGGPVTIVQAAGYSAFEGMGKLLVFLTILSANLAVINFLPIPLLDGGHMVFLAYEGIRGRPASEKIVVAMHAIGFAFIVTIMLFVLSLDFNLIDRNI